MSFEICDECGTRENSQTILAGDCRGCLRAEIARLRAALKPFAVLDKESLVDTLGHIGRKEIADARAALERKP